VANGQTAHYSADPTTADYPMIDQPDTLAMAFDPSDEDIAAGTQYGAERHVSATNLDAILDALCIRVSEHTPIIDEHHVAVSVTDDGHIQIYGQSDARVPQHRERRLNRLRIARNIGLFAMWLEAMSLPVDEQSGVGSSASPQWLLDPAESYWTTVHMTPDEAAAQDRQRKAINVAMNRYAGALLMPAGRLHAWDTFRQSNPLIGDANLAGAFDVSLNALTTRLAAIGLPNDQLSHTLDEITPERFINKTA
jgi:hypothetical protein